ncbi:MAG: 5-methylthioadenosine/S-adenosylhomocysteine nucleosidase [Verrucomicrobiota bacterium]|jgi:adenosylhomocysteine nucleosidase
MTGAGETLVCFALPEEARPFQRESAAARLGPVRVVIHGMGPRNAERAVAPLLEEWRPARVLTCGFAGGLDPALNHGAVLFETAEEALAARLRAAGLRAARFHCATRMAVTAAEKASLRATTGACAVEMESAVIHALCRGGSVPCATLRVISDVAGEDLPLDFNALTTPDLRLHAGRLALAIAGAPWKIPALLRLQRRTASAAAVLAASLARVLPAASAPVT